MSTAIFADLHNHTTASDGDYSPKMLVSRAKDLMLGAIGVTDHDTDAGIHEALETGKALGIDVIPGVEISVRFKREYFSGTLHLLCYFPLSTYNSPDFKNELKSTLSQGRGSALVKTRIEHINAVFGPEGKKPVLKRLLNFNEINDYSTNASRRHFALALKEKHHITDPDTVMQIIGNQSPAYVPSGIDLNLAADFIKTYNVLPVLAHPAAGSFPGGGHYTEVLPPVETVKALLPEFLETGIKGIEVYYPGHSPEHRNLLLGWARQHKLIITGGSDCHDGKDRPLGIDGINREDYDQFKALLES